MELDSRTLKILSCDIAARPNDAAGITDVLKHLISVKKESESLIAEFCISGKSDVCSFADAERTCCTSLSWDVVSLEDRVYLTIRGLPNQIEEIFTWFSQ
jgi:hypothetical protein